MICVKLFSLSFPYLCAIFIIALLHNDTAGESEETLARLAAPIFIETLLIMMLGAVDTVMLSRHSDNSVAAVGVVNQIIMLTFLVFEVINLGTSVLCSQYLGARLHKQVVQVVGVSLLVNFAVGVGISMLLFGCAEPILRLMGLGSELMQDGMDYMRIVGAFAFFQALSLTLSASLRSANKAVYPMLVTVVVNVLNIIGNYSLIFGRFGFPNWEWRGRPSLRLSAEGCPW